MLKRTANRRSHRVTVAGLVTLIERALSQTPARSFFAARSRRWLRLQFFATPPPSWTGGGGFAPQPGERTANIGSQGPSVCDRLLAQMNRASAFRPPSWTGGVGSRGKRDPLGKYLAAEVRQWGYGAVVVQRDQLQDRVHIRARGLKTTRVCPGQGDGNKCAGRCAVLLL